MELLKRIHLFFCFKKEKKFKPNLKLTKSIQNIKSLKNIGLNPIKISTKLNRKS